MVYKCNYSNCSLPSENMTCINISPCLDSDKISACVSLYNNRNIDVRFGLV